MCAIYYMHLIYFKMRTLISFFYCDFTLNNMLIEYLNLFKILCLLSEGYHNRL